MTLTREQRRERKAIRYQCFRIQTEVMGGAKAPSDKKFKQQFESDPWFDKMGGWKKFGFDWDISKDAPFSIVPLKESLWEEWDGQVKQNSIELPRTTTRPVNDKSAQELSEEESVDINIEI